MSKWSFWIDRGGTFTDAIAIDPYGKLLTSKHLSINPSKYNDATIHSIKQFLDIAPSKKIPTSLISEIKVGTTVATNALLEGKGAKTVLVVTKGFEDQLRIGYQNRPDIFSRKITLPNQLYEKVIGVDERILSDGKIITELDNFKLKTELSKCLKKGITSCAILLMHGYKYINHEKKISKLAQSLGFDQVSASHEISPQIRFVERGDTTVLDAYLTPILKTYIEQLVQNFSGNLGHKLKFMQSNGGLISKDLFKGKDAVLSGPAGGVVGAVEVSKKIGENKIIGFDMGGTSTDVCHFSGSYERTYKSQISGVRLSSPMMNINTVAAGGGSILSYRLGRLQVGPESAGSLPGPSSYGNGGPLTVTDANIITGRLKPEFFPAIFGRNGKKPLDTKAPRKCISPIAKELNKSHESLAEDWLNIASQNMANAIKKISVQKGYDINKYCLTVFGGAGGQFACSVAENLNINKCYIHSKASLLSAYGIGLANVSSLKKETIEKIFSKENMKYLRKSFKKLSTELKNELLEQNIKKSYIKEEVMVFLRFQNSDNTFQVKLNSFNKMQKDFYLSFEKRYGFKSSDDTIQIDSISVEAYQTKTIGNNNFDYQILKKNLQKNDFLFDKIFIDGRWQKCKFISKKDLKENNQIIGPAIIIDDFTSILVRPNWKLKKVGQGDIILNKISKKKHKVENVNKSKPNPMLLEVFNNIFMSIAEQMGVVLENTAQSVTIKERLDFSCAVFDNNGDLIANAPHMPVHLGSMDASVKAVINKNKIIKKGDVFALNAPYDGGTHLPDITVIKPIFNKLKDEILFFVAARGHHTDVGGLTPGSMPPDSRVIEDEGVYIDNFKLVENGVFKKTEITNLLLGAKYPVRALSKNLADLRAQVAACEKGEMELRNLIKEYGIPVVKKYTKFVHNNASEMVKSILKSIKSASYTYHMDNDIDDNKRMIKVSVSTTRSPKKIKIDFSGTSSQTCTNFNAPEPVTRAAVLYAIRILVGGQIPMNAGLMENVELVLPRRTILSPTYPAAVIAGNVETSQAVTSALLLAFGIQAASQSTMNNVTWGNKKYQYYETICGGTGAGVLANGKLYDGTSGVHSNMTNSRLTDPEILETRFPVVLEKFSIRKNSGGKGIAKGGDGVIRNVRFLQKMDVSIISGHREVSPPGIKGGKAGKVGKSVIFRQNGKKNVLKPCDKISVDANDILHIKTPGGGGYGLI